MTATVVPRTRSLIARSCRETLQGIVESPLGRGLNLACPPLGSIPDLPWLGSNPPYSAFAKLHPKTGSICLRQP